MKLSPVVAWLLLATPAAAAPFAYVTNERSGTVTVIDTATDKPVYELRTGGRARGIQASADGRTVYVARSDPQYLKQNPLDTILAIDVARKKVIAHLDAGSDPEQFAISRDGKRLYITNEDASTASVTDLTKRPEQRRLGDRHGDPESDCQDPGGGGALGNRDRAGGGGGEVGVTVHFASLGAPASLPASSRQWAEGPAFLDGGKEEGVMRLRSRARCPLPRLP